MTKEGKEADENGVLAGCGSIILDESVVKEGEGGVEGLGCVEVFVESGAEELLPEELLPLDGESAV